MPDQEYYPIDRTLTQDSSGQWVAVCEKDGQVKPDACNKLSDKKDGDFANPDVGIIRMRDVLPSAMGEDVGGPDSQYDVQN